VAAVMGVIVLVKHRLNIKRLIRGEEPKVSLKKQEGKK
jgi:glycerol-3-phosphate acyltransferase PlsY